MPEAPVILQFYCMAINGAKNILSINTYAEDGEGVPVVAIASAVQTYVSTSILEFITVSGALIFVYYFMRRALLSLGKPSSIWVQKHGKIYQTAYERYLQKLSA